MALHVASVWTTDGDGAERGRPRPLVKLAAAWALLLGIAVAWPMGAGAVPITFDFTGTITSVDPSVAAVLASGGVVVGATVTGGYTFESTTPDIDLDPVTGLYQSALLSMNLSVGALSLSLDSTGATNRINICDGCFDGVIDVYNAGADVTDAPNVFVDPLSVDLMFRDIEGLALPNDLMPLVPPDFASLELPRLFIQKRTGPLLVQADLTTLILVPEASSGLLLGAALAALSWFRRRGELLS